MRLIGIVLIVAGLFYAIASPWFGSGGDDLARAVFFDKSNAANDNRGWQVSKVFLEEKHSPASIRIETWRMPGGNSGESLRLLLRVAPIGTDGSTGKPILNQPVPVNLADAVTTERSQARLISVASEEFEIASTGQYKIGAFPLAPGNVTVGEPDLDIDPNIVRIDAIITSGSGSTGTSSTLWGAGIVILGILLLSVFSRRKALPEAEDQTTQRAEETIPINRDSEAQSPSEPAKDNIWTREPEPEKPAPEIPDPKNREPEPEKPKRETDVGKTIQWGRDAGKER